MWGGGGAYDRWAAFLDEWSTGAPLDPSTLPALGADDLPGDAWARLSNRVTGAIDARLTGWATALNRAMGEARDEFEIGRALGQARTGLRSVRGLAGSGALPPELTGRLLSYVDDQIRAAQQSLEKAVDRMRVDGADPRAVERRLRAVRDNPLTAVLREPAVSPAASPAQPPPQLHAAPAAGGAASAAPGWASDPMNPPRRRVIPDIRRT